ncbi:unnamed protein product [Ilex paraguariensis]|uniref:Uncharacterized protein n=1 Tax=Ilex paraguariensis TaxID=185542 RepID=A0ABC8S4W9_9AQUA
MGKAMDSEVDAAIIGQANILQYLYSSVESIALKCAVELRIPDIIHSHGRPMTLTQIAIEIGSTSPSLNINCLARIMRFLVHKQVFDEMSQSNNGESLYSLNQSSKWLLQDAEQSLVPLVFMRNHPFITSPFQCLSQCVKEGGTAFQKTHGREMFEFASVNPEFNLLFNQGMACTAKITTKAMISEYGGSFDSIGSLVDVGGGTGAAVAEIVKVYPHIEGKKL